VESISPEEDDGMESYPPNSEPNGELVVPPVAICPPAARLAKLLMHLEYSPDTPMLLYSATAEFVFLKL
jgi:hypothetical protein